MWPIDRKNITSKGRQCPQTNKGAIAPISIWGTIRYIGVGNNLTPR